MDGAPRRDARMELNYILAHPIGEYQFSEETAGSRRKWTEEESARLEMLVRAHGCHRWSRLAKQFPGRAPSHLRARWKHAIEMKDSKRPFTAREDAFVMEQVARHGKHWADISRRMDRRIDNDVKNRYRVLRRYTERDAATHGGAQSRSQALHTSVSNLPEMSREVRRPVPQARPGSSLEFGREHSSEARQDKTS